MSLSTRFLDELRARTTLSALIGKSVKLQRAGREFKACCPFHNEKSPSFYVNDEKGFYHCFGCGAHGDAIRWMTDQRGLTFIDAVKELAQVAGLELPAPDAREAERAERAKSLHDVMAAAAAWFEEQYAGLAGAAARAYVDRRGLTEATRKRFGLGYAPDSKVGLRRALERFGDRMLIEAGLLIDVEGKEPYDRFRDRLMIPIRDPRGRVIAFGGRIIGQGEPKYLNSPDTPLFDKGRTLYNLDRAAAAARKADRIIVVEGYLDVIALAQAGIEEAVAPLGTALTEFQIERLWRQVDTPLLCFDGDAAGRKAAVRAAHRCLPNLAPGKSLGFVTLPGGDDPDDFIRKNGLDPFEKLLDAPESIAHTLWQAELDETDLSRPESRAAFGKKLKELPRVIADEDVRTQYLALFNGMVRDFYSEFGKGQNRRNAAAAALRRHRISPELLAVAKLGLDQAVITRHVILGLRRHPAMIQRLAEPLALLWLSTLDLRQIREAMLSAALCHYPLESEQLELILREEGLAPQLDRASGGRTLAYLFLRTSSDKEAAEEQLAQLVGKLTGGADLTRTIMEADRRHTIAVTDGDTEAQAVAYRELERLYELKRQMEEAFREAQQIEEAELT